MKKVMDVEGMVCLNCVGHVKKTLEALEGVSEVVVDLAGKSASVELSEDIGNNRLITAVVEAGYSVAGIR